VRIIFISILLLFFQFYAYWSISNNLGPRCLQFSNQSALCFQAYQHDNLPCLLGVTRMVLWFNVP
jgi:hypothetical protein